MEKMTKAKAIISVCAVVLVIGLTIFGGKVRLELKDDSFKVAGIPLAGSVELRYEDIEALELRKTLEFGTRSMGASLRNTQLGSYNNTEFGKYKLYAYTDSGEYIVVRHTNGILVFNAQTLEETENVYTFLAEKAGIMPE